MREVLKEFIFSGIQLGVILFVLRWAKIIKWYGEP